MDTKTVAFPKVLIIGQYFDKRSGAGITMTNLFAGWDKNSIAVAGNNIVDPDFSVCENVYILGNSEIVRDFPFNAGLADMSVSSGVLKIEPDKGDKTSKSNNSGSNHLSLKDKLMFLTGQIHRRRRFEVSKEFLHWVNEFSPDLIYSQLASYELIMFVGKLGTLLNIPLAFHMMDDWPQTINSSQKGIFKQYWTKKIDHELRSIFKRASCLMSISEAMSDEYKKRYGFTFAPFHNPIDSENWMATSDKNYSRNGVFTLLYAGRIGVGLQNCLLEVADAVETLVHEGYVIEFHIQSTSKNLLLDKLKTFKSVKIRVPAMYSELPEIFRNADTLLLPNDFDENSVSFLRYSMPTKASEYMVSGTPVLVYSSSETAVTKHALKYSWASVVSENSKEKLKNALIDLYNQENLRKAIGMKAKEFAVENYDAANVRKKFREALTLPKI